MYQLTYISYHSHMIQLNEEYNKDNHYELKSLGRSAVKFTSAGQHGMLLLCHNQDCQVSLVVFIAAVMSLSGLYSFYVPLPLIHQCDAWEWELMAGLQGFASHGGRFYLAAGLLQGSPLDAPGTHPRFSKAAS